MDKFYLRAMILGVLVGFSAAPAMAGEPICFQVRNTAPYTVMGSFTTDYYLNDKGAKARHRSDFQLDAVNMRDDAGNLSDRAEFCTYGPFYPGNKLDLALRTIFPIFQCMTRVDAGEIVIKGVQKPEGGTQTKALCL